MHTHPKTISSIVRTKATTSPVDYGVVEQAFAFLDLTPLQRHRSERLALDEEQYVTQTSCKVVLRTNRTTKSNSSWPVETGCSLLSGDRLFASKLYVLAVCVHADAAEHKGG